MHDNTIKCTTFIIVYFALSLFCIVKVEIKKKDFLKIPKNKHCTQWCSETSSGHLLPGQQRQAWSPFAAAAGGQNLGKGVKKKLNIVFMTERTNDYA